MSGLEPDTIVAITNAILAVVGTIFGSYFMKIRTKLNTMRALIDAIDDAMYDNKLTKDEVAKIQSALRGVLDK